MGNEALSTSSPVPWNSPPNLWCSGLHLVCMCRRVDLLHSVPWLALPPRKLGVNLVSFPRVCFFTTGSTPLTFRGRNNIPATSHSRRCSRAHSAGFNVRWQGHDVRCSMVHVTDVTSHLACPALLCDCMPTNDLCE